MSEAAVREADAAASLDVVVVGAGIAGLTAGALLAQAGRRVAVVEAHALPGGCASWFTRDRFRFDVGATTLSGLRPGEPSARLVAQLRLDVALTRCDPGVVFHDEQGTVRRFADPARWRAEAVAAFGGGKSGGGDVGAFWDAVEVTADRAWRAAPRLAGMPPTRLRDWLGWLAPSRLALAALLPALRRPVARELARCGIAPGSRAWRFVAEQLAITTQRGPEQTPWLLGAMGLAYPRDTWRVAGGLGAFAQALARALRRDGGELKLRTRVVALRKLGGGGGGARWQVELDGAAPLLARALLFTAPLAALATACPQLAPWCTRRQRGGAKVGAFTLYAGLHLPPAGAGGGDGGRGGDGCDDLDDLGTPFHQLLLPAPLPQVGGRSLFLTFSRRGESGRAPPGARALTVSTHVDEPAEWTRGAFANDPAAVAAVATAMRAAIERAFPPLARAQWRPFLPGTPRTFERYTLRPEGAVGGLGHGLALPPWRAAGPRTPLPALFVAGDTVFPGQGTPAVVQSAEAAVAALHDDRAG